VGCAAQLTFVDKEEQMTMNRKVGKDT
jgi:hypothetical protein